MNNPTKYALLNSENIIQSVVLWDGESEWTPPDGMTAVPLDDLPEGAVWPAPATPTQEECIARGARHVTDSGFDADRKVILLNKLLKVKELGAEALAAHPKLVALYTWMETVQGMAVAGVTTFPAAPHTFEEVVAE